MAIEYNGEDYKLRDPIHTPVHIEDWIFVYV